MKKGVLLCFILFCYSSRGQDSLSSIDHRYREDQFYVSFAYDVLINGPLGTNQQGLSYAFKAGFIRDFPINERRNIALGIGLGYSTENVYWNLRVLQEDDGSISYEPVERGPNTRGRISLHMVEVPLEFRWRTSTETNHSFWRIYGGLRFGYVFRNRTAFKDDDISSSFSNPDVNDLQYGISLSTGYGSWNLHLYYALNTLLNDVKTIDGTSIDIRTIHVGLIFYIL